MKILHLIDGLRSGGKERQMVALTKQLLQEEEFEVAVGVMNRDIYYTEILDLGIDIHYLVRKSKRDLSLIGKIDKLCKHWQPDVVHVWDSLTSIYALWAVRRRGIKWINGSIRHSAVPRFPSKFWLISKLAFSMAHRVVSNSLAGLHAHGKEPGTKYRNIPNGFNTARIEKLVPPEEVKERFDISTPYSAVMVAAFEDRKDYETFIRAARRVIAQRDDVTFLGIGNGKNFETVKSILQPGDTDRIKLPGRQRDVESIVNAADVALLINNTLGHGEGTSNAILEYMALGKPVIATDSGGNKELVSDGETGFIIDSFIVDALVEKVTLLLDHPEQAREMGLKGKKRLETEFSFNKMVGRYIGLYNELKL